MIPNYWCESAQRCPEYMVEEACVLLIGWAFLQSINTISNMLVQNILSLLSLVSLILLLVNRVKRLQVQFGTIPRLVWKNF